MKATPKLKRKYTKSKKPRKNVFRETIADLQLERMELRNQNSQLAEKIDGLVNDVNQAESNYEKIRASLESANKLTAYRSGEIYRLNEQVNILNTVVRSLGGIIRQHEELEANRVPLTNKAAAVMSTPTYNTKNYSDMGTKYKTDPKVFELISLDMDKALKDISDSNLSGFGGFIVNKNKIGFIK